jgi:hypothetical protein
MIGSDADVADQLVVTILKETYEGIQGEVDDLSRKRRLAPHEEQDLKDSLYNLRCLQQVIQYFSMPNEFEKWLDEVSGTE